MTTAGLVVELKAFAIVLEASGIQVDVNGNPPQ
jgi:hypothetical protein